MVFPIKKYVALASVWAFFVVVWWINAHKHIGTLDFMQYWTAVELLVSGKNPYDAGLLYALQVPLWSQELPFAIALYCPPIVFPFLFPLAGLDDFQLAAGLWNGTTMLALFLAVDFLVGWCSLDRSARRKLLVLLLSFVPAYTLLYYGQISHLLLLGIVPALRALRCDDISRSRSFLVALGLAVTMVKPHLLYLVYIVLAIEFLKRRYWWILIYFFGLLAALSALPYFINPHVWGDYVAFFSNPPTQWKTPTVSFWLQEMVPGLALYLRVFPALILSVGLLLFWKQIRRKFSTEQLLLIVLPLSLATAPYGWLFDQILLLPLIVSLLKRSSIFYLLVLSNLIMIVTPRSLGQEYFLWFPIVLFIVAVWHYWSPPSSVSSAGLGTNN